MKVCVERCPSEYFYFDNLPNQYQKLICSYGVVANSSNAQQLVNDKKCAPWYLNSQPCKNFLVF